MLEFTDGLGFNLANALTGDVKLFADLFQGVVRAHLDAKSHAQHFGFARRQAVENVLHHITQTGLHGGFDRCGVVGVFDEIAQVRVVIVANRCFHRNWLFGDFHDLADFVFRDLHLLGQRRRIGLETKLLQMLTRQAVHFVDGFDHVHRNTNGASLVGDRTCDGLADPPRGVSGKLVAAAVFEFVHRFHQANVAFLNQIQELQAAVGVFLGNRNHQTQVGLDHLFLGITRSLLAFVHAFVDALQVFKWHHGAGLLVDQLFLQFLNGRQVARQHQTVGLAGRGLFLGPLQVQDIGREILDEILLRHAAFVDQNFAQLTLIAADVIHLRAQNAAEFFNGFHSEANGHQLAADRLLRLVVGG